METFKKNKYGTNEILDCGAFYISFQSKPGGDISFFQSDGGQVETALVNENALYHYLILNGDFRNEYLAVHKNGYDACLEVYDKFKDQYRSSWSSDFFDN